MAEVLGDFDDKTAAELAVRLLAAQLADSVEDSNDDQLVRAYYLATDASSANAEREIRDLQSGIRTHRADDVLAGDLLEFILAR